MPRTVHHLVERGADLDVFSLVALGHDDKLALLCTEQPNAVRATLGFVAQGRTPLHVAAERGFIDVVRVLLDCRADVNARTTFGETPLSLADSMADTMSGAPGSVDIEPMRTLIASHAKASERRTHVVDHAMKLRREPLGVHELLDGRGHGVAGEHEQIDGALIDRARDVVGGRRADADVQIADARDAQLGSARELRGLDDVLRDFESMRLDEHAPQHARDAETKRRDRSNSAASPCVAPHEDDDATHSEPADRQRDEEDDDERELTHGVGSRARAATSPKHRSPRRGGRSFLSYRSRNMGSRESSFGG